MKLMSQHDDASVAQYGPTPTPVCLACVPPGPPTPHDLPITGYDLGFVGSAALVILVVGICGYRLTTPGRRLR